MNQSLDDVEYIFVNDATPDNSMEILRSVIAKYPKREVAVKIVNHEVNKGLPAARNTGLNIASGDYVFHCDSDDFVEPDMLEQLYETAIRQEADIIWCDWYLSFEKNERYMKQPAFASPVEALKGMLRGTMKFNVWNKLVKRKLYIDNDIQFPTGYGMGEDMTMMMLFASAVKVAYLPKAFYHYVRLNAEGFCQTYSERHLIELKYNAQRIIDYLRNKFEDSFEHDLAFFKLDVKFPFLISNDNRKYKLWIEWYPEANRYIRLNRDLSYRRWCLQWCAWKKQFWVVRLHYWLVCKVIYGIIYR